MPPADPAPGTADGRGNPVLVIAGPTASGKSGLALNLAQRLGGVVINADSMQVYGILRILTARPGPAEEALAPHRLYGIVPPDVRMSAAAWAVAALAEIRAAVRAGALPVLVGGTGLYLRTLIHGIADVPEIPPAIRAAIQARAVAEGATGLHPDLTARDPEMAARLNPNDTQRLVRALEVLEATGRSLLYWQEQAAARAPADLAFHSLVLAPPRERLYAQADTRFLAMLERGAMLEAQRIEAMGLDPTLAAAKALGLPELRAVLRGERDLPGAIAAAQQATRNYAKRQMTWFRHQMPEAWQVEPPATADPSALEQFYDKIIAAITQKISD